MKSWSGCNARHKNSIIPNRVQHTQLTVSKSWSGCLGCHKNSVRPNRVQHTQLNAQRVGPVVSDATRTQSDPAGLQNMQLTVSKNWSGCIGCHRTQSDPEPVRKTAASTKTQPVQKSTQRTRSSRLLTCTKTLVHRHEAAQPATQTDVPLSTSLFTLAVWLNTTTTST